MRKKLFITVAVIVIFAATGWKIFVSNGADMKKEGQSQEWETYEAKRADIPVKVIGSGSLELQSVVEIKSEVSGVVKKLFVEEGETVQKGQRLASIELEETQAKQLMQLRADLEEIRLNLDNALRELDRETLLMQKKFTSKTSYEQKKKAYDEALIREELAKKQLLIALHDDKNLFKKYTETRLAETIQNQFIVLSPVSGTVVEMTADEGEIISSGTSLSGGTNIMKVGDISNLIIKGKINEVDVENVKAGNPVFISVDAISEAKFEGLVSKVSPVGKKENNIVTYDIFINFKKGDLRLKPAMSANIDIVTSIQKNVLYVPLDAVISEKGESIIYMDKSGQKEKREIKISTRTNEFAVITAGVEEGEKIILNPPVNAKKDEGND